MSGAPSQASRRAAQRLGAVLRGKYTLERVLGVGGMAAVYLGVHRNGNRVAVKILHPELSIDDDVRARFLREGYAANSIGHTGAVRVLDDDVAEDGAAFLVMELLEGETLEQRRQRLGGKLPLREVMALGHQLLDVLAAAHDKGVVHRDVKPENLFLTRGRELKVLDFGIARLTDAAGGPGTFAGSRIGTPAFMPPEQALGRTNDIDARTDVWATGATLFTLCSGRFVHEAEHVGEVVVRAATRPAPSLATVAPEVPEAVVAVVDRALSFARDDRWSSARAMRDALAEACVALHGEAPSPSAIGAVPDSTTQPVDESALTAPAPVERRVNPTAETQIAETSSPSTLPSQTTGPLSSSAQPSAAVPAPAAPPSRLRAGALAVAAVVTIGAAAAALLGRPAPPKPTPAASASASTAAPPGCTSARACIAASGGKPAICRKEDGACVPLESPDCHVMAEPGDIGDDATVWIGAMFPISGPDAPHYGAASMRAVDLARRDFLDSVGGLPPVRPGAPKRPIALVTCDDRADPVRVATHLVDELRVPAVIGFARSREVMDLAASHFGPRGVLALAANTASTLRDIPGRPRLVWRVTTSGDMMVPPTAALLAEVIEPALRKEGLRAGEAVRVALCRINNASGLSQMQVLTAGLRFNGKSALENGDAFRQIVVPDEINDEPDDETKRRIADELLAFAPHVVIDEARVGASTIDDVEARWPKVRGPRPRWVWDTIEDDSIRAVARARPSLRGRLFDVDTATGTPVVGRFVLRYNEVFSPRIVATNATAAPYDAFYVFAYAAAALGDQPLTGTALARAIPRLLPPGEPVEVGPGGIYGALNVLAAGRNIDLQGVITTLDFDVETGDATADFAVFCFQPGDNGELRSVESGLVYEARTRRFRGALHCPAPR